MWFMKALKEIAGSPYNAMSICALAPDVLMIKEKGTLSNMQLVFERKDIKRKALSMESAFIRFNLGRL